MTEDAKRNVAYGVVGTASAKFQGAEEAELPLATAADRLKSAIRTRGLWVLHEIDPQALLAHGGYDIGQARQILFFHPRYVARILAADPSALLEAPLKIALLEMPGGQLGVRWFDPAGAFARYHNQDLDAVGAELAGLCEAIIAEALDPAAAPS